MFLNCGLLKDTVLLWISILGFFPPFLSFYRYFNNNQYLTITCSESVLQQNGPLMSNLVVSSWILACTGPSNILIRRKVNCNNIIPINDTNIRKPGSSVVSTLVSRPRGTGFDRTLKRDFSVRTHFHLCHLQGYYFSIYFFLFVCLFHGHFQPYYIAGHMRRPYIYI